MWGQGPVIGMLPHLRKVKRTKADAASGFWCDGMERIGKNMGVRKEKSILGKLPNNAIKGPRGVFVSDTNYW